jgi:two-component system, LuxR family, response regulator FixJ
MINRMSPQTVYIIDDDEAVRDSMSMLLEVTDMTSHCFENANEFLEAYHGKERGCLILDIRMPGLTGLELQKKLNSKGSVLPIIFMTGHGDVPMAVDAMREGAFNFLRKPINEAELIEQIELAFKREQKQWSEKKDRDFFSSKLELLTPRETEIFNLVAEGCSNKVIAYRLEISERTVEVHRSQVMKKMDVQTLADLIRIKIAAG